MSYRGAVLSECGLYRYRLHRRVTASDRIALFIMLNPSTADADQDDATIRRCMGFTRALGCGMLEVVNLFAFRTKSPKILMEAPTPIGPDNDRHIHEAALEAQLIGGFIICAWGAHGIHLGRGQQVCRRLTEDGFDLLSLDETRDGHPRHPLYLPNYCKPQPYRGFA
jgi:hypothetical protein